MDMLQYALFFLNVSLKGHLNATNNQSFNALCDKKVI
ncbi:hypothetical protein HMPREF2087_01538 [Helicobacter canis NCTC 12740]|uniref:Uncharacterized protein n=1 Tax=Helicobacter canis NCTC 12740 TaxID=1357399 RepID=V8CF25_9HELI|nr:hypothetical protein HMPREF2087_01538 [Helicobacter canis NCTC 12740]